ncbi:MAG: sigma factor [Asticcacaulis sp.]
MTPPHPSLLTTYLEQRTLLVRLFSRRTGDPALAEDVVQDLYLRLETLEPDYRIDNRWLFCCGWPIICT